MWHVFCKFWPPVYEVLGEVIFSVCLSVHQRGVPQSEPPPLTSAPPLPRQDQDRSNHHPFPPLPSSMAWTRTGYPHASLCPSPPLARTKMGIPLPLPLPSPPRPPGQDWDRMPPPLPSNRPEPWQGIPSLLLPTPLALDTTRYGQDTPRAVRLLRSRRRTVLLNIKLMYSMCHMYVEQVPNSLTSINFAGMFGQLLKLGNLSCTSHFLDLELIFKYFRIFLFLAFLFTLQHNKTTIVPYFRIFS